MPTDPDQAPFLLLSIRGEDEAADDEYQAMMRFAGLDGSGMHRIRLTHRPLGPVDLDDWSGIILGGGPVQRQRSGRIEERDAATGRIRAAIACRRDRRQGLPVPRMLLRRWHAGFGHRCHRRPQLSRTGCRRYRHADRSRPRRNRCSPTYQTCSTRSAATRKRPVRFPPKRCGSPHRPTAPCRPSGSVPTPTRPSSTPNWTWRASSPGSTSTRTTATSNPNPLMR